MNDAPVLRSFYPITKGGNNQVDLMLTGIDIDGDNLSILSKVVITQKSGQRQ